MPSVNESDIASSSTGGSKNKKNRKRKGATNGKPLEDATRLNGTRMEDDRENEDNEGEGQEADTPNEGDLEAQDAVSHASFLSTSIGLPIMNGSSPAENLMTSLTADNGGKAKTSTGGTERKESDNLITNNHEPAILRNALAKARLEDADDRFEALVQERMALQDEVAELRQSLDEIQGRYAEELQTIRRQLEERTGEKEHAETQYRNLLGKVNTIRSQLGERLKADAEDLAQAKGRIEELEEQCDGLRGHNEARTAELAAMAEEEEQRSKELSGLRNRTTLSQQNWAKEREDLVQREAMVREEFEAAKQAMQDWEILAIEERSMRENTAERLSDLEDQLSTQRDAYEKVVSERDSQSQTVDGLQRALQDIQDARRKELRDLVENSQMQVGDLQRQLDEARREASAAAHALEATQSDLERALPFEKEVKEKNLLIGKLRHEAVILNDHLTKALRYLKKGKPDENIDKQLVTNHFLHFLALERADPKKFQVLQIIAALLGWTDGRGKLSDIFRSMFRLTMVEQREQAGLARPGASNPNMRVPISPWHRTPSTPALSTDFFPESSHRKESLAELWSDFLEQEAHEGDRSRSPSETSRSESKASGLGISPKR
ncbi:MAG: hypothetical protein Q9203_000415 [Teloschistes exilis]